MAKYSLTSQADVDIDEIVEYIALDDLVAALSVDQRITSTFEMLALNPYAGRDRPDLDSGIRSFPEGSYMILYRVWASEVVILRVLHVARDMDELFS